MQVECYFKSLQSKLLILIIELGKNVVFKEGVDIMCLYANESTTYIVSQPELSIIGNYAILLAHSFPTDDFAVLGRTQTKSPAPLQGLCLTLKMNHV